MLAVERGATWLRVIGATGGRLDQILSNIYLLALPSLDPVTCSWSPESRRRGWRVPARR